MPRNRSEKYRRALGVGCGEELRTGASGVPLAAARDLHREVVINRQTLRRASDHLGIATDVSCRMLMLIRRHGVPSTDRLILLSVPYPERTYADIAAAFKTTVDRVNDVVLRAAAIRRAEPLSTELWEDITETTATPDEIYARAAEVRRLNELDKREVLSGAQGCAPCRDSLGQRRPRLRVRRGAREEDCPARA